MSNLLKIYKAVNNDEEFRNRVEIACSLASIHFDDDALIHVANQCVDHIELSDAGTVDSSEVTDDEITTALENLPSTAEGGEETEDESEGMEVAK